MNTLFEKFIRTCKNNSQLDTPLDLIIKCKDFIQKQYPDLSITIISHKYIPASFETINHSEYSNQIVKELTNIKGNIAIKEADFNHIDQFSIFPILNFKKQIQYLLIFSKLSTNNEITILSFLQILQIFYNIITGQLIHNSQITSEKNANLISQITHDFTSALKLIDKNNASERKPSQYTIMIKNLLFYIRDIELVLTTVNSNELIDSIIENVDISDEIVITKNFSKEIKQITVDVELINKAMGEILKNAVNAISENNGRLNITTKKIKKNSPFIPFNWIEIKVTDTGCGIPDEFLPMVKDPFFTTFKSRGHFGLGLSNAEKIIKAHQGCIKIDSVMNKGTDVLIYLPEK